MLKCNNGCLISSFYDLYFFSLEIKVSPSQQKSFVTEVNSKYLLQFLELVTKTGFYCTPNSGFYLKHTAYSWKLYNCWENYTILGLIFFLRSLILLSRDQNFGFVNVTATEPGFSCTTNYILQLKTL